MQIALAGFNPHTVTCSCNNRVQGTGFSIAPIIGGIGSIGRTLLPVIAPPLVGIGIDWTIGKLLPKPTSPATPAPLEPHVDQARNEQRESKISLGVGTVVVAGLALYLLTKRRR